MSGSAWSFSTVRVGEERLQRLWRKATRTVGNVRRKRFQVDDTTEQVAVKRHGTGTERNQFGRGNAWHPLSEVTQQRRRKHKKHKNRARERV